jgi:predicted nucleic acid-binding protein
LLYGCGSTIELALELQERYGFSYYDCLIIASALEAECEAIYTEDLGNGQKINGVKIKNIFY